MIAVIESYHTSAQVEVAFTCAPMHDGKGHLLDAPLLQELVTASTTTRSRCCWPCPPRAADDVQGHRDVHGLSTRRPTLRPEAELERIRVPDNTGPATSGHRLRHPQTTSTTAVARPSATPGSRACTPRPKAKSPSTDSYVRSPMTSLGGWAFQPPPGASAQTCVLPDRSSGLERSSSSSALSERPRPIAIATYQFRSALVGDGVTRDI